MTRRSVTLSLSLAFAVAAPGFAGAEPASEPAAAAETAPATQQAAPADAAATPAKLTRAEVCTGTRIRPALGQPCPNTTLMRSYSQTDLQRTGQIQVGDALRLLDPIFR